jgi:mannose-6-phosphate isomerase-like protein (cupin superfamily)
MADFTKLNLKDDVEDMAPKHGMTGAESRFARKPLGLAEQGVSYFRFDPDFRLPFGHRHGEQEEVYVVVSGSGRMKLEDEMVELKAWDAVRVPGSTARGIEAGPDGLELIAVGAPNTENKDAEMLQDFWG